MTPLVVMSISSSLSTKPLPLRQIATRATSRSSSSVCWSCATRAAAFKTSLTPLTPPTPPTPLKSKHTQLRYPTPSRSYSTSNGDAEMSEPTGLKADKGIELLTLGTPNGFKASILLEELKDAYGKEYTWQAINIMKNTQKEPWYTAICPNGRIPAIVDHDRNGFAVFEGLAILTYLTKHYDPEYKFSFPYDSDDYSVAEQWMSWQHGGVGPMQGQANHFLRFAKEKIPYGTQRYVGESERLYGVLEARLKDRDFVVGPGKGKFSIADISLLGWANIAIFSGIDVPSLFPNVDAWIKRCLERPGVQRGFAIPSPSGFANAAFLKKKEEDAETKEKEVGIKKFLDDAKAQYNYKYASP